MHHIYQFTIQTWSTCLMNILVYVLSAGRFAVQLTNESPFASIPVDQAVEETVNKDM